jgi:hypothetical protein
VSGRRTDVTAIKGIYRNGQVILDRNADWPDGSRVMVEPIPAEESVGIREDAWPTDPEGIARHLALMERIEPLEMTPEEEAEWRAARKAQKEHEKANFEAWSQRIEDTFR